ncbi:MAG: hypothetical protein AAF662_03420 [Pseudomonadota bacterium]
MTTSPHDSFPSGVIMQDFLILNGTESWERITLLNRQLIIEREVSKCIMRSLFVVFL